MKQADALREAEIEQYAVLGRPPARDLQALVELAAQLAGAPFAAINLVTAAEQHQLATVGIDPSVCRREDSMCASVLEESELVVVSDARVDERFSSSPFVDGPAGDVRFYASAPLVTPAGITVGRLCVFDAEPRSITAEQYRALTVLAERVVDVLELRLRTHQLERSLTELTEARDELRRSNEQLALFAGQVSHDLRNPLTALLAHAEMMADLPSVKSDEDATWMVTGTVRSGRRMVTLIDDLLDYARVGGGLNNVEVELDDVVEAVTEDLLAPLHEAGAQVIAKDLPVVRGDWAQLYSVFQNLISNAARFGRAGVSPRIVITAERAADRWRIEVADNGTGVAEDRRAAMFALLARGSKSVPGSGIGLATCKRIVEAHGGRIGMDDSPEGGLLVWFELPG